MDRFFFAIGGLSACVAVAAGAFGAHALKGRISVDMLAVFEVAVRYQMYHALALLACAGALPKWPGPLIGIAGWLFICGTALFSGSLYALALSGVRGFGAITPLGGVAFIAGWLCFAAAALRA